MSTQTVITYTFNAPRELVFKAFTEAEHLRNWWGPKGWEFRVAKADFRSGGVFHYSQKPDDGDIMWVKFEYSEIVTLEKIVYTSSFSDKEGHVVRAPFDSNWPMKILHTMTFFEDQGKTFLTLTIVPVSPTEEELRTFENSQDILHEGFTNTFDHLVEYLTRQ
ncbi:SRPBCC domain-containing protein [Paenibacillus sp. XY044]|uniref:SRPBCC family protein n=1 Tax=Paenibacillus sp. XY044 TaxID=2026089 RepID=UPI00211B5B23|nr:SRPBCC domain-containing protein [Paenibacillus sp. XY044]